MLPTFCPPTIWTISLEFCRKPSILAADAFWGACYRKAMIPQKLWTLYFFSKECRSRMRMQSRMTLRNLRSRCGNSLRMEVLRQDSLAIANAMAWCTQMRTSGSSTLQRRCGYQPTGSHSDHQIRILGPPQTLLIKNMTCHRVQIDYR